MVTSQQQFRLILLILIIPIETSAEKIIAPVETPPFYYPSLFALDPELLIKKAGKPACRTAINLIEQWEDKTLVLEDTGTQLKIQLP